MCNRADRVESIMDYNESDSLSLLASTQMLQDSVADVCPEAKLVASQKLADSQFLAFTVPSYFGRDVLE